MGGTVDISLPEGPSVFPSCVSSYSFPPSSLEITFLLFPFKNTFYPYIFLPSHRQGLDILTSIGPRAFADVGLNFFCIQIIHQRGLNSLYILIFDELVTSPVYLVRKREKVAAGPSYRISTTRCGHDVALRSNTARRCPG